MAQVTINEAEYRIGRLNTIQQAHLVRRLLPLFSSLTSLSKMGPGVLQNPAMTKTPEGIEALRETFSDIAGKLADLSDEQFEYVLHLCMSVVDVRQGERWAPIWNRNAKRFMFDNIDLLTMMQLCASVIQENLTSFLPGGLSSLTGSPEG
jgi:hypothetical protein